MADKKKDPKQVLEREYIVPLRKGWLKVPKYKRATKAVKTLKEFLAKHMKIYDSDLRKIKIDLTLNNEIRFRGMRKPPAKIKVKAVKYEDGIVRVELVDIPDVVKFRLAREEKKKAVVDKKVEAKKVEKENEEKKEEDEEGKESEKKDEKEKKESIEEKGLKKAKEKSVGAKQVSKDKDVKIQRKALSR